MNNTHFPTLIKYIGISLITGAIAHGFFSGTRQVITAIVGVIVFVIGTLLEKDTEKNIKIIMLSVGLAIGIGAITGGIQHFPDSPERSAWIIPVGMLLSLGLYGRIHNETLSRSYVTIMMIGTVILSGLTYYGLKYIDITPHNHGNHDTSATYDNHDMMDMSMRDMGAMLEGKTGAELNRAFLEGMIPHHQGAIEMAAFLAGSDKPELVQLGTDIIAAQQKEIDQMRQWMIEWGYTQTGSIQSQTDMHTAPDGSTMHH